MILSMLMSMAAGRRFANTSIISKRHNMLEPISSMRTWRSWRTVTRRNGRPEWLAVDRECRARVLSFLLRHPYCAIPEHLPMVCIATRLYYRRLLGRAFFSVHAAYPFPV